MMSVIYSGEKAAESFKTAYGEVFKTFGKEDERVVLFDADLLMASGGNVFRDAYPERTFDCGVQEADMIGVAAGLSERGFIPFTHSFTPFASRKVVDQVFMAGCYNNLNVKMIGTDPGVTAALNGGTHMGIEDMGVFYSFPNITLIEMTDTVMFRDLMPKIKDTYGMFYVRMSRKEPVAIYGEGSEFEIGKGIVVREGTDATIIASGLEVGESLKAAELLEKEGLSVRVVDMFTWKPIDEELIVRCAAETGAVVTAENHSVNCGLGKEVARVLALNCPVPMRMIGFQNVFGQVGPQDALAEIFGLTAADIAKAVREAVNLKK